MEAGGHTDSGFHWYGTANKLQEDGWRTDSPTEAGQLFGKFGWRNEATDVSLSGAYADTDLTGNGLQDMQFLENDYSSVYTKPDNTKNKSWLLNLVGTHKASDILTLSGNAFYRNIKTRTSTVTSTMMRWARARTSVPPAMRPAQGCARPQCAGRYRLHGSSGRCGVAGRHAISFLGLRRAHPAESRAHPKNAMAWPTARPPGSMMPACQGRAAWNTPVAGKQNLFTLGAGFTDGRAHFVQSSEFGYLTPDRGIVTVPESVLAAMPYPYTYPRAAPNPPRTVPGPGNFADGTQDSENLFDSRVDLVGKSRTYSVYLSDTVQLAPIVQLTVSGRYDRTRVDSVDGITPEDEAGTLTASHKFSRFNPAAGITIRPSDTVSAYLALQRRQPCAVSHRAGLRGSGKSLPAAQCHGPAIRRSTRW